MSEADRRLRANAVGLSDGTARTQLLDSPPFNLHIIDSHSPTTEDANVHPFWQRIPLTAATQ